MKKETLLRSVFAFILLACMVVGLVLFTGMGRSEAGEVDILIQKLVEKGVLTAGEAQQVLTETKEEVRKEVAQGKSEILPKWVQTIKPKGDLRLRYQWQDKENSKDRHRARMRFRFGAEAKVLDDLKVGFQIASGGSDPRSTNQTFQDSFSSKGINLDLAYAEWQPTGWFTLVGGKFKNPLWCPSDLIWDSDINPEGAATRFDYKLNDCTSLFANVGFFILDELSNTGTDPLMWAFQPGISYGKDNIEVDAAVSYYAYTNVEGKALDHSENTNSRLPGGGLEYDFDSFVLSGAMGIKDPGFVNYLGVFGDYVQNTDPSDEDSAWLVGFKFGDKKVGAKGQWQCAYSYRRVERDSILDILPDSDFFAGKTNVKGHEAIFEYGLAKNVSLGLDYYHTEELHGSVEEDLLQLDWKMKF